MPIDKDTTHLQALRVRLSHERDRLNAAKTKREREMRAVWVAQAEKELAGEMARLDITEEPTEEPTEEMSVDDLAKALEE